MIQYYQEFFSVALEKVKNEERYREFLHLQKHTQKYPISYYRESFHRKNAVVWCSNDYMGMSQNPAVVEKTIKKMEQCGIGAGGTRNISGSSIEIEELESLMAHHHKKEAALVFTSGYVANQTTIATLVKIIPNLVIFSDQFNHASIIEGIRQSGCKKHVFEHNDMQDLERLLQQYPLQPKIIIFESIYSMEGDVAPVKEICALAKKYNAMTYIDEVHTVGIYGETGAGITEELDLQDQIDIIQGTFSKAYGVMGGYITGSALLIDSIRSYAQGFIFTTALPPAIAYAAQISVLFLQKNQQLRKDYLKKIDSIRQRIIRNGFGVKKDADFHIIPIMISNSEECTKISKKLLDNCGIYLQAINFPTVPHGTERLRITATPFHSEEMIDNLLHSLQKETRQAKIPLLY